MAHAEDHIPSLLDTMQAVPYLLTSCASSNGVKRLRLVCKPARTMAGKAITSYHLRLTHQPSTRPLLAVAALMQGTLLRRLHVDVSIPKYGTSRGPAELYNLASQIEQLQQLSSSIGPALATVTSLQLTIQYTVNGVKVRGISQDRKSWIANKNVGRPCTPRDMTEAAAAEFAILLASACPNISHLDVGGAVGKGMLRQLGLICTKLTSLEIIDGNFTLPQSVSLSTQASQLKLQAEPTTSETPSSPLLPRLTHLKMGHKMQDSHAGQVACVQQLLDCPSITHMELQEGWLNTGKDLMILPRNLKALSCSGLALYNPDFGIPARLHLGCLETILLSTDEGTQPVNISILVSLLAAAPSLASLSVKDSSEGNCIVIDGSPPSVIESAHKLHQRMEAGFRMEGVMLLCQGHTFESDDDFFGIMSLEQVLKRLPHLPTFSSCGLQHIEGEQLVGCLSAAARLFPKLEFLLLFGDWWEEGRVEGVIFHCLEKLEVHSEVLTSSALLRIVDCAPKLSQLQHCSCVAESGWVKLQAQLRATQVCASGVESNLAPLLGDWTLRSGNQGTMMWGRGMIAM